MKQIAKNELYQHLSGFLKTKGIELKEGSYSQGVAQACALLTDAINLGQKGFTSAKVNVEKKLDQLRQVIHEKTAPAAAPGKTVTKPASPAAKPAAKRSKPARKTGKPAMKGRRRG